VETVVPETPPASEVPSTSPQQEPARATPSVSSSRAPSGTRIHRQTPVRPESGASAAQDFAEAMHALSRGDFSASAKQFEAFASAHAQDPRVEEATYLTAIALERSGRISDAKAAAERYLALYANGAHRTYARRIVTE
jgi:outer membrane protein assembly factor BamD (BamD/ComL family)